MTRVLVVEDSPTQAEQLRLILEAEEYSVDVAGDAEQALAQLEQTSFDLVISDILMPGLNGYDFCRRVKANQHSSHVPIILLTTLNDPMDIIQGLECGADNFITKPYEHDYLVARVRSFLDNRELRASRKLRLGVDVAFLGRTFTISSEKEQILDLLIATFEDIVRTNRKLQDHRAELAEAKAKLEEYTQRLEHQVHASEERYRRLFENANDAIIVAQVDSGRIIDANPGAARLIGRPPAELAGIRLYDVFSTEDGVSFETAAGDPAAIGGRMREGTVRRLDGTQVPVEVSASVFELNGKRLFQGVFRDISGRKLLEQQLRQAQRMESIGQLTGGIAHDFNNILGITIGNLDLLMEDLGPDPHLRDLAQSALNGATRGADLVRRLLAFSRNQSLEPRVINLNDRLSELTAMLRRTLDTRITISTVLADDLWPAFADPSQVEDAILNLAINARDAMPDGGRLTVETANAGLDDAYAAQHSDVTPGDYVLLAVSDTGTGMSQAVIDRVFEPFFTTKGAKHGSGLGLSQVYGFVKQSGGHIKIYSEVGRGTTVKIFLPRAQAKGAPAARRAESTQETPRGQERVLVVEDDAAVRKSVADQLQSLGYRIGEAADGQHALAHLTADSSYDLVFTDILMPGGMTGYDLAREVTRRWPNLKILLTSGYTQNAERGRIHTDEEPQFELLSKPYRRRELAQAVRSVLDREAGDSRPFPEYETEGKT